MSSSPKSDHNTSSSTYRVNYSDYVADITGSPKTTRKVATTGIGHHINPLHNQYPSRQNQPIQPTSGMPQYGGGNEKCARCSKNVYLAEKKVGAGRSFHSSCFNCHTCKRKLDASGLSEHKGEIYCKTCYTRQFGAHGLISGVTMSTEKSTQDQRPSRRASSGTDLDTPVITHQQSRQRTQSNSNLIHDEHGGTGRNNLSEIHSWRNDDSFEQHSNKKTNGINAVVDTKYQKPPSPVGFNRAVVNTKYERPPSPAGINRAVVNTKYERPPSPVGFNRAVVEPNINFNRQRSTYTEEDDRRKYIHDGEKISYASGTSALVNIPVVVSTKRSNSTNERIEMPTKPIRHDQRSRSPSPSITSYDSYQRQGSRERQTDLPGNYSPLKINEDNNNRKYPNDHAMNNIATGNPLIARNFQHSSSTSSHESNYRNSTSSANNYDREQYHSRDASPSATVNRHRSSSPTSGYISSSTTHTSSSTYRDGALRDSTIPSTAYIPQHEHRNSQTSANSNVVHRRSTSPKQNERTPSSINQLITKNLATNMSPPVGGKNSTLAALVQQSYINDDDDFDN